MCDKSNDCVDRSDEKHCNINECATPENGHCAQLCNDTQTGWFCSCRPGYKLMADTKGCEDINECKSYDLNRCDQLCVNTKGSYKCTCADGYKIMSHGGRKSCKLLDISSVKPYLLFSEKQQIWSMDVDRVWERILVNNSRGAIAIDFDIKEQRIYWSESHDPPLIKRAFLNGTGVEVRVIMTMRKLERVTDLLFHYLHHGK